MLTNPNDYGIYLTSSPQKPAHTELYHPNWLEHEKWLQKLSQPAGRFITPNNTCQLDSDGKFKILIQNTKGEA